MASAGECFFSVFVGNVPCSIHWRRLRDVFANRLKVIDVFLAKTRGQGKDRFGFVRILHSWEAENAIKWFNGVRLLNRYLLVAKAKNGSRRQIWRRVSKAKNDSPGKDVSVSSSTPRLNDSYVIGEKNVQHRKSCVADEDDEEFSKSLKQCIVGSPIGALDAFVLQKILLDVGLHGVSVRQGPSGMLLIIFKDSTIWKHHKQNEFNFFQKWLLNINIWNEAMCCRERDAWVYVYGLPANYWSRSSFVNLASLWGSLLQISERTTTKRDLSKGFIQIRCNLNERIDDTVEVRCNGVSVPVRVVEFEDCSFKSEQAADPLPCGCLACFDPSSNNTDTISDSKLIEVEARRVGTVSFSASGTGVESVTGDTPTVSGNSKSWNSNLGGAGLEKVGQAHASFFLEKENSKTCFDFSSQLCSIQRGDEFSRDELALVGDPVQHLLNGQVMECGPKGPAEEGSQPSCGSGSEMGQEELGSDPFGLEEGICRLIGTSSKNIPHPRANSALNAKLRSRGLESREMPESVQACVPVGSLNWTPVNHVNAIIFGPSDMNLDFDGEFIENGRPLVDASRDSTFRSISKSNRLVKSTSQSTGTSQATRSKKGVFSFGFGRNDRVKVCAYAKRIPSKPG